MAKAKPKLREVASDNSITQKIIFYGYNPDELITGKSVDVTFYDRLASDDKVSGIIKLCKQAITKLQWDVTVDDPNDKLQMETRDFTDYNLRNLQYEPFNNVVDNLLDARIYGYKVAELTYEISEADKKAHLKHIKCKKSEVFNFDTDKYDNIKPNGLILTDGLLDVRLNPFDFVIFTYPYKKDGNWYGISDLKDIYREWWSKDVLLKLRNIGLERHAMPVTIGFYDDNMSQTELDKFIGIVNNLTDAHKVTIPATIDLNGDLKPRMNIEFRENKGADKGFTAYDNAIDKINKAIARYLGVPDDIGFTDTQGGSYARAETQFTLFIDTIQNLYEKVESVINEQVIKRLVDINFNVPADFSYPKLQYPDFGKGVTKEKAEIVKLLIEVGMVNVQNPEIQKWAQEYLGVPIIVEEEEEVEPEPVVEPEVTEEEPVADEEEGVDLEELKRKGILYQKSAVNYKRIEGFYNSTQGEAVEGLVPEYKDMQESLTTQVLKYDEIADIDIKRLFLPASDKRAAKQIFETLFIRTYLQGKFESVEEIEKKGFEFERSSVIYQIDEPATMKWIKQWSQANQITLSATDLAYIKNARDMAFTIIGVTEAEILNSVKQAILTGAGRYTIQTIVNSIDEVFNKYTETASVGGKATQAWYLETVVRTNSTRMFNDARMNLFHDPDIKGFVKAYEYSAILDSVTTDFCLEHNGEIISDGDPRLLEMEPPNHFNCRSLLSPITAGEDYTTSWGNKGFKTEAMREAYNTPAKGFGGEGGVSVPQSIKDVENLKTQ